MRLLSALKKLAAAGLVLAVVACGPAELKDPIKTQIERLPRGSYEAPQGMKISYLHAGDPNGRRVIFVHGTPGDAEGWGEFLLNPPPGFEYISVDRPGFGQSGPKNAVTALADQASALTPLLVERNGAWPILVGHSLGGPIVAQIAADYPDKVGGLLIAAGSLDPSLERIHTIQWVGTWWPFRAILPRAMRNANYELIALKPHLEALEPKLGAIRCPIYIVHGTKDPLVPYSNMAFMQARFTAAQVETVTIAGENHFLPWKRQKELKETIGKLEALPPTHC